MPWFPFVAIELPADTQIEHVSASLRACNLALGEGRCILYSPNRTEPQFAWIARVKAAEQSPNCYVVTLCDAQLPECREERTVSATRTLAFTDDETAVPRWSTVGVVIAALVVGEKSTQSSDKPRVAAKTDTDAPVVATATANNSGSRRVVVATNQPTKTASPPSPQAKSAGRFRLDVGALLGKGLETNAPRLGAQARPSWLLTPSAFLWTGLALSRANQSFEAWVWSGAVGAGFAHHFTAKRLGVEARFGLRGDHIVFHAEEGGKSDTATGFRWGATGAVDGTLQLSRHLALWFGVESTLLVRRVRVSVRGTEAGNPSGWDGLLGLGLRYRADPGALF